jgi:hypothetical protein
MSLLQSSGKKEKQIKNKHPTAPLPEYFHPVCHQMTFSGPLFLVMIMGCAKGKI